VTKEASAEIWLVRHGQTVWNTENRIQGHYDVPLNEVGMAQARRIADRLRLEQFDAVYSSDLVRATQTANLAADHLQAEVQPTNCLREINLGQYEGLTIEEVKSKHEAAFRRFASLDSDFRADGGESLREFFYRVNTCIEKLVWRHTGGRILLFAHGGVVNCALNRAEGLRLLEKRFHVSNGELAKFRIGYRDDSWTWDLIDREVIEP